MELIFQSCISPGSVNLRGSRRTDCQDPFCGKHRFTVQLIHLIYFKLCTSLAYFAVILYLGINFYFNTTIRKSWKIVKNFQRIKDKFERLRVRHKTRFLLSVSFVLLNCVLSIYVIVSICFRGKSLSTPFLMIFGGNMFLYFLYYGVRKIFDIWENLRDREKLSARCEEDDGEREEEGLILRIARRCGLDLTPEAEIEQSHQEPDAATPILRRVVRWFSLILFCISNLTGLIATYFYLNKHQSRNVSPAESRERNQLCR